MYKDKGEIKMADDKSLDEIAHGHHHKEGLSFNALESELKKFHEKKQVGDEELTVMQIMGKELGEFQQRKLIDVYDSIKDKDYGVVATQLTDLAKAIYMKQNGIKDEKAIEGLEQRAQDFLTTYLRQYGLNFDSFERLAAKVASEIKEDGVRSDLFNKIITIYAQKTFESASLGEYEVVVGKDAKGKDKKEKHKYSLLRHDHVRKELDNPYFTPQLLELGDTCLHEIGHYKNLKFDPLAAKPHDIVEKVEQVLENQKVTRDTYLKGNYHKEKAN